LSVLNYGQIKLKWLSQIRAGGKYVAGSIRCQGMNTARQLCTIGKKIRGAKTAPLSYTLSH
jgi:hypothetical protein